MEGGIDVEERASDAVPEKREEQAHVAEESGEDNKFQKAIGAWRSMLWFNPPCEARLTMRQILTLPRSFPNSTL
jgi:hypothetical protein